MAVSGTGLSGSASFTANQAGASSFTVTSNATSANTASTIVARDASGNFSAGTITAALSGNATTATTAANVNNGTLTLAVSGTGLSGSQTFTANQSSAATFTVTSNATNANTASTIVARDASGNFSAGTITASLSGNASTATSATSATTAGSITSQANSATITASTAATANQIVLRDSGGDDFRRYGFGSYFNSVDDVNSGSITYIMAKFGDNYYRSATAAKVATFISGQSMNINGSSTSCSGNAATATLAANTSSINNAVGGSYTWTAANYFQSNLGSTSGSLSAPPLQAYATGGNSAFFSWHRAGNYAVNMGLDSDNILRIGGWSAPANLFQLTMAGALTMASNVTAHSDERLKKDWAPLQDDFVAKLAKLKSGTYTRIDSGERHAGVGAQSLEPLLPETVLTDSAGTLSVAYGNAAMVSAVELAKDNVELRARIEKLEALVAKLIEG
jgi:hypothetical protein